MNAEKQNKCIVGLGIAIIFMSFVTLGAFLIKNPIKNDTSDVCQFATKDDVGIKINDVGVKINDLGNQFSEKISSVDGNISTVNERMNNIDKRIAKLSTRLWLMSVIQNENTNLSIQTTRFDPGYIYFDENWRINRLPRTMQMDNDTKLKLETHIKEKSGR